jgi:hypothetical protein
MVTSSSGTGASTADGRDGGVAAGFSVGIGVSVGTAVNAAAEDGVDACTVTGDVAPVLAGTEPSISFRSALRTGVEASAGSRVDVDAEDEFGAVGCAGTSGGVLVLTGTESVVAAAEGVVVVVCAQVDGVVPALAITKSGGGGVRVGATAARGPSAVLRLIVDAGDELGTLACAGTSGDVPVLAGTEFSNSFRSALRKGVEASAGLRIDVAGTCGEAPVLTETESGVGDGAVVNACAGICRADPVLAAIESGNGVRGVLGEGIEAST